MNTIRWRHIPGGGGREDTCDHGLSRRLESIDDDTDDKKWCRCTSVGKNCPPLMRVTLRLANGHVLEVVGFRREAKPFSLVVTC